MYTGIIQACLPISQVKTEPGLVRFALRFPSTLLKDLHHGASVSIDGVCVTVVDQQQDEVWFDAMQETLVKTTLGQLTVGRKVNIERSASAGSEVGGHIISGHVDGMAEIVQVEQPKNNQVVTFHPPKDLMKYIFNKGFIALDGASLTVVDVDQVTGTFKIWFIPETLRVTTFGFKHTGDRVNLEVDYQTKVLVDTVERVVEEKLAARGLPAEALPFMQQKKTWLEARPVE